MGITGIGGSDQAGHGRRWLRDLFALRRCGVNGKPQRFDTELAL